jgi:glycolate oxidase
LRTLLGERWVLTEREQLRTYECDGLAHYRAIPGLVVLPANAEQVAATVDACVREGVPYVARGAGTGLSGGALPSTEGVLIVLSRLNRIIEIDPENQRAVVQPCVINLDVSRAAADDGLFYAPDPSSQGVCTIGGNVAENAGGAHCLKYGFTVNHVTSLEVVTGDGELVRLGGMAAEYPGYDLAGAFVGSEGTLGIATEATVRLLRKPEAVDTVLAAFDSVGTAGAAVAAIIAAGIVPAAIEMMDALAIEAAEAAVNCRYPPGAGAVLIVELDGPAVDVAVAAERVEAVCREQGAFAFERAIDDEERLRIWRGRKSAFAAVGRISPNYLVQDGVVPRASLALLLERIEGLAREHGIRVANVFHAGDGNLHPLVLFDGRIPGAAERAEELAGEVLNLCIQYGGSITGEHGVGVEKLAFLARMFGADDLETQQLVRCAFDPPGLANPGKLFPTPRLCGEAPGVREGVHPLQAAGLAELF